MKKTLIGLSYSLCIFFATPVFAVSQQPVAAKHGMVVSEQELASRVGVNILQAGGNAIDAAVAVGYALAVVNPCCGNIGGGGFMTIHLANGNNIFLNFREKAPLALTSNLFLDKAGKVISEKSKEGYLAVAVPGTVLGLETALKKYGTMTRQQVMKPAIELAEKGYVLTPTDIKLLGENAEEFKKWPTVTAIFFPHDQAYKVGERLIQQDLADTLKLIAEKGPDIFYKGQIAAEIVEASKANGGVLSLKDFSDYNVEELTPIFCAYHDYTIISAPPPSSGGVTLCEVLNIIEDYPLNYLGFHSAQATHYIVEAMRHAFYDRNSQLGDPDFIRNPVEHLISKQYAAQIRRDIQEFRATPSDKLNVAPPPQQLNTTHYSVVDALGNAVAVTYTLNGFFGAHVIAGHTGFFLNDEIDDFTIKPGNVNQFGLMQGIPNLLQPGKRPLSSMTPTLVSKGNQVVMVLGSPGGPRIITSTLQTILNVIDYGMNIQEAVDAPRFHHQWYPDSIDMEPFTFSTDTIEKLAAMGYRFTAHTIWGAEEAIYIDPVTKWFYGANDNRRPAGKAIGY
jgi:gamma-glutamyltranspeptidase/glutathione hydrolase